MNNRIYFRLLLGVIMALFSKTAHTKMPTNSFVFQPLLTGKPISLDDLKGKVILIVNTASKCGFTGQYDGLEKLFQNFRSQGFMVIGVPSNDFGSQEPGTSEEISTFCKRNYGVTFPITMKYNVKGKDAHPFYKLARSRFGLAGAPKWNFHKYLISRKGELVNFFHSTTKPSSSRLIKAIEAELK
ncbi:MAG: Thioredoxin/glutathione peroxidase BtuE [Hyphomicrobiaceae bacterium hypho_1]